MQNIRILLFSVFGLVIALLSVLLFLNQPSLLLQKGLTSVQSKQVIAGSVLEVISEVKATDSLDDKTVNQLVKLVIIDESSTRKEVNGLFGPYTRDSSLKLATNESVLLEKFDTPIGSADYKVVDRNRSIVTILLLVAVVIIIILAAGKKGIKLIFSLTAIVGVLAFFVFSELNAGINPVLLGLIASLIFSALILFIGNSFTRVSLFAFIGVVVSQLFVSNILLQLIKVTRLDVSIQFADLFSQNLSVFIVGVLMITGGLMVRTASSQAGVIDDLNKTMPDNSFWEVLQKGISQGRVKALSNFALSVLIILGTLIGSLYAAFTTFQSQLLLGFANSYAVTSFAILLLCSLLGLILVTPITSIISLTFFKKR
jgi:uncharacterized membrane protein